MSHTRHVSWGCFWAAALYRCALCMLVGRLSGTRLDCALVKGHHANDILQVRTYQVQNTAFRTETSEIVLNCPAEKRNRGLATRSRMHGSRCDLDRCARMASPVDYILFCQYVLVRRDTLEKEEKNTSITLHMKPNLSLLLRCQ